MSLNGTFEKGKIQVIHIWGKPDLLANPELVKTALDSTVRAIGMTPYSDPILITYPIPQLGFTCTQALADDSRSFVCIQHLHESYIVYDNWPEYGYANIVINSCKTYDVRLAVETIMKHLKPNRIRLGLCEEYSA